jgi:hypothetical protein
MRAISGKKILLELSRRSPRCARTRSRNRREDHRTQIAERCRTPRRAITERAHVAVRAKTRRGELSNRASIAAPDRSTVPPRRADHRTAANATSKAAELRA